MKQISYLEWFIGKSGARWKRLMEKFRKADITPLEQTETLRSDNSAETLLLSFFIMSKDEWPKTWATLKYLLFGAALVDGNNITRGRHVYLICLLLVVNAASWLNKQHSFKETKGVVWCYLDSRQHDCDQVVVGEKQGTYYTAVTNMLDDG